MEEINLLQNRIKDNTFAWERQSRVVNGLLTFILILILGTSGLLYFLHSSAQAELDTATAKVKNLQGQLNQKQGNLSDAKTFQAQISNIRSLIGAHTYLSPVLDELSSSAYSKTKFVTLDVSEDTGKVHLEGVVSNYVDLGKMILGLSTSNKFDNVKLQSVLPSSGEDNTYHFSVDLIVKPELFAKE